VQAQFHRTTLPSLSDELMMIGAFSKIVRERAALASLLSHV
jgi:hypothetical protein